MEAELTRLFTYAGDHMFVAFGILTRVGAALFLVPGLGERAISIRVRLGAAIAITLMLLPIVLAVAPAEPSTPTGLVAMLAAEAAAGLILGLAFRFLVFALQIAGMVAAQHLSVAQMFGAGIAPEPEPTISTLLAMGGITLALMAGLHVHVVAALSESYRVFPFGAFPDGADSGRWMTGAMTDTFALGVGLAAPFIAIGFAYNLALGALNRAMPQLLVALVGVPFLVWVGMLVLYLVLPSLMETWRGNLDRVLIDPLGGWR